MKKRKYYKIIIKKNQKSLRIDKFLNFFIQNISRKQIKNFLLKGKILVNRYYVKHNYYIKPFDLIEIIVFNINQKKKIFSEKIPLDIIYEDEDIIIINKKTGIIIHPGNGNYKGTILNALKYYIGNFSNFYKNSYKFGIVHRIDKNTSGLLIFSKNEYSFQNLSKQFLYKKINRKYIALVWGDLKKKKGTIIGNIGRNNSNRIKMNVFSKKEKGKYAITHYKVLKRFYYITMVSCKLETGRTHQIRVHFKYIGHPIINDKKYGGNKILKGQQFSKYKKFIQNCFKQLSRQALHATYISFFHPIKKKKIYFKAPIPYDIKFFIKKIEKFF